MNPSRELSAGGRLALFAAALATAFGAAYLIGSITADDPAGARPAPATNHPHT